MYRAKTAAAAAAVAPFRNVFHVELILFNVIAWNLVETIEFDFQPTNWLSKSEYIFGRSDQAGSHTQYLYFFFLFTNSHIKQRSIEFKCARISRRNISVHFMSLRIVLLRFLRFLCNNSGPRIAFEFIAVEE